MPDPIEPGTPQLPEVEDFVAPEGETLTPEQISEKKSDFYKNLLKQERVKKHEPKLEPQAKPSPDDFSKRLDETEKRIEWKADMRHQGYSPEEIRNIEALAKGLKIPPEDAAKHPFVTAAVAKNREEAKSKAAMLEPSSRSVMVGEKSASDILKDKNTSAADKQAAYEAQNRASLAKRKK